MIRGASNALLDLFSFFSAICELHGSLESIYHLVLVLIYQFCSCPFAIVARSWEICKHLLLLFV
jgi:hypothetical protein